MSLNKILLSTLIFPFLFLNNCRNDKKEQMNIKKNTKEIILKSRSSIESIVYLSSSKIPPETIKNNEYLSECIKENPHLQNEEYMRKNIKKEINNSKYTFVNPKNDYIIPYNISELTLNQLQRICLMVESLKDSSFIQEIGSIIKEDVRDKYSEHGGIVLFNENRVYLKTLKSYVKRDTSNDVLYGPPDESFHTPNLGGFHLHAQTYNEAESANPSDRDLITSYYITDLYNEANDFLITPIKKGIFNINYYGGDKFNSPVIKVMDLGTYTYDTTRLK